MLGCVLLRVISCGSRALVTMSASVLSFSAAVPTVAAATKVESFRIACGEIELSRTQAQTTIRATGIQRAAFLKLRPNLSDFRIVQTPYKNETEIVFTHTKTTIFYAIFDGVAVIQSASCRPTYGVGYPTFPGEILGLDAQKKTAALRVDTGPCDVVVFHGWVEKGVTNLIASDPKTEPPKIAGSIPVLLDCVDSIEPQRIVVKIPWWPRTSPLSFRYFFLFPNSLRQR